MSILHKIINGVVAVTFFVVLAAANAQTLQMFGKDYVPETGTLPCANNPIIALTSAHPKTNGWTHAAKSDGVMCFGEPSTGLSASPLEFDSAFTGVVKPHTSS